MQGAVTFLISTFMDNIMLKTQRCSFRITSNSIPWKCRWSTRWMYLQ